MASFDTEKQDAIVHHGEAPEFSKNVSESSICQRRMRCTVLIELSGRLSNSRRDVFGSAGRTTTAQETGHPASATVCLYISPLLSGSIQHWYV